MRDLATELLTLPSIAASSARLRNSQPVLLSRAGLRIQQPNHPMAEPNRYSEKLRDPRWQKRRLLVLEAANWQCEDCGRKDKTLEVHHCAYIRGMEPWEYPPELLMADCSDCHAYRQSREDAIRVDMGKITRFMKPGELDSEAWEMVHAMSLRQTQRMASAFLPPEEEQ